MQVPGWFSTTWKHICHACAFCFRHISMFQVLALGLKRLRCQHGFHRFEVCVKFEISVVLVGAEFSEVLVMLSNV